MIDFAHAAGKYGAYIWPAYAISGVGLIAMIADTVLRARYWRREVDRRREDKASVGSEDC